MPTSLNFKSAVELRAAIVAGHLSPVDVVDSVLERIKKIDGNLGSYFTVNPSARQSAQDAERSVRQGEPLGPLHGIPFSVKDLIVTEGLRTTRGSAIFSEFVPDFSAPAVERAQAAGAILIGKTATAEFGWKAVTDCLLFGETRNPWDTTRTPGGSSGGAAAAVAAGLGPLALATDAGGSTRLPAAFCGVFGMKPSFGRIPVYPAPVADTLVHAGLMTRAVADCALLLSVVSGPDERDRNSLPDTGDARFEEAVPTLQGVCVGWCPNFGGLPVDPEVLRVCEAAVRQYQQAGLEVDEIEVDLPDSVDAFETLFVGNFGAQLVDALPKWHDQMDPGLVRFVESGRKLTAYDLAKANLARAALWDAMRKLFGRFEFLLLPVASTPPPLLKTAAPGDTGASESITARLGFLYPFNLTGQPAASIPCGWTGTGLPVGLQIVGRRFQDTALLRLAAACEQIHPWADRTPPSET